MKITGVVDEYVLVEKLRDDRLQWLFVNALYAEEWKGEIKSGGSPSRDVYAAFRAALRARGRETEQEIILAAPIPRISVFLPANADGRFRRRPAGHGRALSKDTDEQAAAGELS